MVAAEIVSMSGTGGRLYPARPLLAASVAVFRKGHVLLARRTRRPGAGRLALPGGQVEPGETMAEAALRELFEETAVRAKIKGFNAHHEIIDLDADGRVRQHYVIASFVALWQSGEGQTGPEAAEIVWAARDEIAGLALADGMAGVLLGAWAMAEGHK